MPVWQRFYENHVADDIEFLSVAVDAQGPDKVLPYVQFALPTFTTVIDEENFLGQRLGFRAVPNGFLIDELGIIKYQRLGGIFTPSLDRRFGIARGFRIAPDFS